MKACGKIVLLVAVVVAIGSGLYLGAKSLFGGREAPVAESKNALVEKQLQELQNANASTRELIEKARRDLASAAAPGGSDENRRSFLGFVEGYLKMLAEKQASEEKNLLLLSQTLKSHTVDEGEYERMKRDLQTLAEQEFKTEDKTRREVLERYKGK